MFGLEVGIIFVKRILGLLVVKVLNQKDEMCGAYSMRKGELKCLQSFGGDVKDKTTWKM
jgi:hypothetical protein